MVTGILLYVAALLLIIVLHEAGHALMAVRVGVRIKTVQFGVPSILKFRWGSTKINIGALPFIGWVRLQDGFDAFAWRKQAAVLLAGPFLGALSSLVFIGLALTGAHVTGIHHILADPVTNICDSNTTRSDAISFLQTVNQSGVWGFLYQTGIFGMLINIANLIPFPGLDGGRLFTSLIKRIFIRHERVKLAVDIITALCFLLLVGASVWILIHDGISFVTTTPTPC